jgi:ribonuclease P protein subunit RPR2
MRKRTRKPAFQTKIAKERIGILLDLAKKEFKNHPERCKKYVELARKIGKRYNVRLTKEQKRNFCKKCNQLLIPNETSETIIDSRKKVVNIKCINCSYIYKYPYNKGE